jgi:hypothetical protein
MAGASTIVPIQLQVTQKHQDEWCEQIDYDKTARSDFGVSMPRLQQESDYLGSWPWSAGWPTAGRAIICVE